MEQMAHTQKVYSKIQIVANGGTDLGNLCGFHYGPRFNIVNTENHEQIYSSITTFKQWHGIQS